MTQDKVVEKKDPNLYAWDHGADFAKTYDALLVLVKENRGKSNGRARRALTYSSVLLTQLRNGSRVSEAFDSVKQWVSTKEREQMVKVRKRKHTVGERLMVTPKELSEQDRLDIKSVLGEVKQESIEMFSVRRVGYNSHSLRYSGITEMSGQGIAPQLIAKITGHVKLDFILGYTSRQKAEDLLRELR